MAAPGPAAILVHLELAVQSTKVPREPILITENEGEKKNFPHFAHTDHHYALLCTASGSVSLYCYVLVPPLSQILYPPLPGVVRWVQLNPPSYS